MKQVGWHSRRSKAHRGLPEAQGQSETHGDSNLYTMGTPMRYRKTACFGPWFWNLILLNLAAASCYLHGKDLAAAGSESFMVEKSIAGSGARAEHFKQQRKALLQLQMQFVTVLMLALLRPSRRTRQNRNQQQSAASGC